MIFVAIAFILIWPDINKTTNLANEISKSTAPTSDADPEVLLDFLYSAVKILIFAFIMFAYSVVFVSGFGSMVAEAISEGKTTISGFFTGIKKNFVRTLLFILLLMAFSFGVGIVLGMISLPFTIISSMNNAINGVYDYEAMYDSQRIISALSYLLMIFIYPLFLLWIPSVYLDKSDGIIATLKKGVKAGLKNYKQLVVLSAILLLPSVAYLTFDKNPDIVFTSPAYIALLAYQVIMAPIFFVYLFNFYFGVRK
jgi:flagellar biosynthesis protein FlhB